LLFTKNRIREIGYDVVDDLDHKLQELWENIQEQADSNPKYKWTVTPLRFILGNLGIYGKIGSTIVLPLLSTAACKIEQVLTSIGITEMSIGKKLWARHASVNELAPDILMKLKENNEINLIILELSEKLCKEVERNIPDIAKLLIRSTTSLNALPDCPIFEDLKKSLEMLKESYTESLSSTTCKINRNSVLHEFHCKLTAAI